MSRPVDSAPARSPPRQQSSLRTDQTQSPRSPPRKYLASAVPAISALDESLRPLACSAASWPPRQQSSLRTDQTQSPRSPPRKYLASAVPAISALNESLRPLACSAPSWPPRQQSSLRTDQTQRPRSTPRKYLSSAVPALSALNNMYNSDLAYIQHHGFSDFARAAGPGVLRILRSAGITSGHVLDLGCGDGTWLRTLGENGFSATGIDQSASLIEYSAKNAPAATLRVGSVFKVSLPRCDAIT